MKLIIVLGLACASISLFSCSKADSPSLSAPPSNPSGPSTPVSSSYSYSYDSSFKSTGTFATMGAIQPDGKIIIANNLQIARLNKDGSLDNSFATGQTTKGEFHCLALQKDGKILLGGSFTNYNGTNKAYYIRLNSDGSFDNSFKPLSVIDFSLTVNSDIKTIVVRPDNKIILGGVFFFPQSMDNIMAYGPRNLTRLNADGSLDPTFKHIMEGLVTCLQLFPDNSLLVGGTHLTYEYFSGPDSQAHTRGRILKLKPDGALDTTFLYGGTNFEVTGNYSNLPAFGQTTLLQTDGKILFGGRFNKTSTVPADNYTNLMRLNPDGSIDRTLPERAFVGIVTSLCYSGDRLIIGTSNDTAHTNFYVNGALFQVNKDGTDNTNFKPLNFLNWGNASMVLEDADKNLVLIGLFYDHMPADNAHHGVVRLKKN